MEHYTLDGNDFDKTIKQKNVQSLKKFFLVETTSNA